jgi:glycosyltransferase involved in cell wall biosynthesis
MRIAVVGSKGAPFPGGVEIAVEEVFSRLAAMGHSVTIFSSPRACGGQRIFRGCLVRPSGPGPGGWFDMPARTISAVRFVRAHADMFDVVHVHSVDPFLFARGLGRHLPVAVTSHGQAWRLREAGLPRRLLSKAAEKAFLASSAPASAVSASLSAWYSARRGRPVEHIPNGARTLSGGDGSALERFGLGAKGYALFVSGRLIPSKGLVTLFRAWKILRPGMALAIAGPDPAGSAYGRRMIGEAPPGTVWCGVVTGGDLGDLVAGARLAVFPSLAEAQSLTLLELLASGAEVVYSDIPGNVEACCGLGVGFETGNPDSLAEAMAGVLERRGRPGLPDLEDFRNEHHWNRIADLYLDLLGRAAGFVPSARARV